MDKFIQDRKNITLVSFDKQSVKHSSNIRTEDMVSFHVNGLILKYRFKNFDVKFIC